GWHGLAQVQFVVPDDGVPRMIDLNPRFYGSLALAVASGSDFPALWAALATGRPVAPAAPRTGVRYHWLGGDLRRALVERRGGLLRDVASCVAWSPGTVNGVWSAKDPRPALRSLGRTVGRRLG